LWFGLLLIEADLPGAFTTAWTCLSGIVAVSSANQTAFHFFLPLLSRALLKAIAIACFCGRPAAISVLILDETVFLLVPDLSGIVFLMNQVSFNEVACASTFCVNIARDKALRELTVNSLRSIHVGANVTNSHIERSVPNLDKPKLLGPFRDG